MMDNDDLQVLLSTMKQVGDTLGQAQAINQANQYILMEVVRDLARASDDPDRYLSGMFERISGRADQGPIEKEAHPVAMEFRNTISLFFAKARHNLE
ncbi:hypothetical protein [Mesorhizobium sp. M0088]|uniref:hypothetical protein n=1 Tax=Mesorhizobium sp. M0088 TaxID=2956873 RepID=UPI00333912E8